jgi:hypothetical protein
LFIPGYGNVLTADFSKPVDPNKIAPGVARPVSAPTAGPSASFPNDPFLNWNKNAPSPFSREAIAAVPDIKYTPDQIIGLYDVAQSQGRAPAGSGNEGIFKGAFDKALKDYGLTGGNGGASGTSTSPGMTINFPEIKFPEAPEYSRVAKPLSADMLQAFGQRRLTVDQAYQNALAQEESGIGRFRASFEAAKQRLDNEYNRASDRMARQLAGRGLARSPMIRGRAEREMGQVVGDQLGEMKLSLASEIEALQQASEQARVQREAVMAQIEQDEALARSQSVDYIRVN